MEPKQLHRLEKRMLRGYLEEGVEKEYQNTSFRKKN